MGQTYSTAQSNTGTCTMTVPAAPGATWNLTSLTVSMAGPTVGPNARLSIWDGAVGTGTLLYLVYLSGPGTGSVGSIQEIPLPRSQQNLPGVQGTPGNAFNVQVTGTGANQVSINGRFSDALPS